LTFEDVLEEMMMEEIEDERDYEELKDQRRKIREKLVYMVEDISAKKLISENQIIAVCRILQEKVPLFDRSKIKDKLLYELVANSEVFTIDSDSVPLFNNKQLEMVSEMKPMLLLSEAEKDL
jgi:hypothetical protein